MVSPGETSNDVVIDAQRESVLLRNTARAAAAAAATTSRRAPGGGGGGASPSAMQVEYDEAQWESGSFDYKRAPARSPGVRESTPTSTAAAWSRSRSTPNSKTFRDSLKRSVLKVKEFSQELVRLPTRKAGPSSPTVRIAAASHDPLVDSELGLVDDDCAVDLHRRRLGPSSLAPAPGNKKKALVARNDSTGAGFALEGLRFIAHATVGGCGSSISQPCSFSRQPAPAASTLKVPGMHRSNLIFCCCCCIELWIKLVVIYLDFFFL
jgi:hypothetical protein